MLQSKVMESNGERVLWIYLSVSFLDFVFFFCSQYSVSKKGKADTGIVLSNKFSGFSL